MATEGRFPHCGHYPGICYGEPIGEWQAGQYKKRDRVPVCEKHKDWHPYFRPNEYWTYVEYEITKSYIRKIPGTDLVRNVTL